MAVTPSSQGGLNHTSAARAFVTIEAGADFEYRSLAIKRCDDDPGIRERYRPFLLDEQGNKADWVDDLELGTVTRMAAENIQRTGDRLKTAVFKNQIDWIPLSTGSVRPTQGRTLAIAQVSGGSQSFNTVNSLRILGRWMRMFTIPNQSSIPKAFTQYTNNGGDEVDRLMSSGNRDRLVDCMEEFVKYTIVMKPHFASFGDRYSERQERRLKDLAAKERQVAVDGKTADGPEESKQVNGVQVDKI
ncbi:MAG: hypothetical protein Q9218_001084 [Villophora microphyllina]